MSKKVTRNRKATFALEPDGFSIHTIELSYQCTRMQWLEIKQWLYKLQGNRAIGKSHFIYEEFEGRYVCTKYAEYGIRIKLEYNGNDKYQRYYLRMIINPRKLIDPESSYIGILPPTEKSICSLKKAFKKLFKGTSIPNDIDSYKLRRVDLCTNIRCDNEKIFREIVRVLRKLPTPKKYTRKLKKGSDKKKVNQYNKHYIRFSCGTHELIIYDKTYQIEHEGIKTAYEKLPESVLRFEVQCERDYILNIEKKSSSELKTTELLSLLMQESEERILKHFSQCFYDVDFCVMNEIQARIQSTSFKEDTKGAMLELSNQLRSVQSVDEALSNMANDGIATDKLLDKFKKIGISPIPLRENFCAKKIPGPVGLLNQVADGDVIVDYRKTKYK